MKTEKSKLRMSWKSSSNAYFLHESGTTNSIVKILGNKEEQERIAKKITIAVNMHNDLVDALETIQESHGKTLLPIIKTHLTQLIQQAKTK